MTIAPERGYMTAMSRIELGEGGQIIVVGSGSPEGVVRAGVGSLYLNATGTVANTTAYVKRTGTGATGWFPVTA